MHISIHLFTLNKPFKYRIYGMANPNEQGPIVRISKNHIEKIKALSTEKKTNINQMVNQLVSEALDYRENDGSKDLDKNDQKIDDILKFTKLLFFTLKPATSEILEVVSMQRNDLLKNPKLAEIGRSTKEEFELMCNGYRNQLRGDKNENKH